MSKNTSRFFGKKIWGNVSHNDKCGLRKWKAGSGTILYIGPKKGRKRLPLFLRASNLCNA